MPVAGIRAAVGSESTCIGEGPAGATAAGSAAEVAAPPATADGTVLTRGNARPCRPSASAASCAA
eukprot:4125265-Alexandrium_andersonii.AAC.1